MSPARIFPIVLTALLAACGPARSPESDSPDSDASDLKPAEIFFDLEDQMVQAEALDIGFHVTAEGAIEVDLRGTFRVEADGSIQISASGIFAGARNSGAPPVTPRSSRASTSP